VPLSAYDATIPAGHILGLILTQSDQEYTEAVDYGATVELTLRQSTLTLPLTNHAVLTPTASAPATNQAPTSPVREKRSLPR
jgi:X-Pro dipeptidyl-peptidase